MTGTALTVKSCRPCEGGLPRLTSVEVDSLLQLVPGWRVIDDGQRIRRDWQVKDFANALDFFSRIGAIAENEGHHPDLHLVGYRNVTIELWTHAIGGLSENDFILAAKIDLLPIALKD